LFATGAAGKVIRETGASLVKALRRFKRIPASHGQTRSLGILDLRFAICDWVGTLRHALSLSKGCGGAGAARRALPRALPETRQLQIQIQKPKVPAIAITT
jgi:hypothetical protein